MKVEIKKKEREGGGEKRGRGRGCKGSEKREGKRVKMRGKGMRINWQSGQILRRQKEKQER